MNVKDADRSGSEEHDLRRAEFDVVAGRRYRFLIDACDDASRAGPRGMIGKLRFLDGHGDAVSTSPEGSVQTDRHGPVVYLPTHAPGDSGAQPSGNTVVAPAGAVRLHVQVRNWKCSATVAIRSPLKLVEYVEQEVARYDLPLHGRLPHTLDLTLRSNASHARATILSFEFLDEGGEVIAGPYEDCLSSPRFGQFRYLGATDGPSPISVSVLPPLNAARLRFTVYPWKVPREGLAVLGVPRLEIDIPDGLEPREWKMLSGREWSEPFVLAAGGEGLVYLSLDCVGTDRKSGAVPRVLVEFLDEARNAFPVEAPIVIDSPSRAGRRGGFFPRPEGAIAVRLKLAASGGYGVLYRGSVESMHVAAEYMPGALVPVGSGQSLVSTHAASSLWSARIAIDGFATAIDDGEVAIELTLLDAAGTSLCPQGILIESSLSTVKAEGNVLKVVPHAQASGTRGIVRLASHVRIMPPRKTASLVVKLINLRSQGLAADLSVVPHDTLDEGRLEPDAIGDLLVMDDRVPAKVRQLAEAYFQRHNQEPRVLGHLLDGYRRIGDLGSMESVARTALSLRGPKLGKLHVKARHALALMQELDPYWLPNAGLGLPVANHPSSGSGLRVAHLFKTTVPIENTGGAIRCLNIVNFQRRIGMRPIVVTPLGYPDAGGTGDPWEQELIGDVPYFRLNGIGRRALRSVTSSTQLGFTAMLTARLLGEQGIDIVQASSGYRGYEQALVGLAVSRALNVPFVYEVRSYHEHTWRGMTDWLLEADHTKRRAEQENRCMREADAVVTICETMKRGLVERGIPADKIFVVPNSVDLDKFHVAEPSESLRARLGLGENIVAGYISNVSEREGHHVLLRAVAKARASGVGMKCLIVGTGPELGRLRALADQLGISDHVVFTGEVPHDQVPEYYALIDIFVVPRIADFASDFVTPMKPFEAMATGRPLVVSDRPALLEIVGAHGQRGFVFGAGDSVGLADRLVDLASAPETREALAQEGRRWIKAERSWDRTIRIYDQVYAYARQVASERCLSEATGDG